LLWVLGLKLPVAFLVTFGTLLLFVRSRLAWLLAFPWFLVGAMQIISVLVNWWTSDQPWWMIGKHFFASYVSGWFMLGAAIAIGASGLLRQSKISQAINCMTLWSAALASAAYLLVAVIRRPSLYILCPTAYLIPQSLPSREFSFGLFLFSWDHLFGLSLPRISLFYPWPNVLGVAGVCTVFILWGDEMSPRSKAGVAIGIFLAFASLGRLEIFALLVCAAFRLFLACEQRLQAAAATAIISGVIAAIMWIGSPSLLLSAAEDFVTSGRAGASEARQAVYDASWAGVRQSPILGHGWPGALLTWDDSESVYGVQAGLSVGTHSAISGLLYKGGALTFAFFCIALLCSIAVFLPYVRQSPKARNAITIWLALALTCVGEGLESLVLPICFVFIWLGNAADSLRRTQGAV
jgi:hypothetical protein